MVVDQILAHRETGEAGLWIIDFAEVRHPRSTFRRHIQLPGRENTV